MKKLSYRPPKSPEELKALFPRASESTIRANFPQRNTTPEAVRPVDGAAEAGSEIPSPKPKPRPRKRLQGEVPRTPSNPARHFVRIESRRRRLTDEDNLCAKYHLDALRYARAIPDDNSNAIKLEVFQTKVETREEEETIVEVFPPGMWPEEAIDRTELKKSIHVLFFILLFIWSQLKNLKLGKSAE